MKEAVLNLVFLLIGSIPLVILLFVLINFNSILSEGVFGMVVAMFVSIVAVVIVKEEIYES
mgnify:FL=1